VRGSIRLAAPCRCVPVNSDVMPRAADLRFLLRQLRGSGMPRPLPGPFVERLASCASRAPRTAPGSRVAARQSPSRTLRPVGTFRTAVGPAQVVDRTLSLALRRGEDSFASGCCAASARGGSTSRVQPPERQWHNRSVDTDAQRQGAAQRRLRSCAARRLAAGRRSPLR